MSLTTTKRTFAVVCKSSGIQNVGIHIHPLFKFGLLIYTLYFSNLKKSILFIITQVVKDITIII